MTEGAPQRNHALREVLNGLRWIVRASAGSAHRTGAPWRMMPNAPPPWFTVYQQTQRWLKAGVFETLVHDLRAPPLPPRRGGKGGGAPAPRAVAVIVDARTMQLPPCPPCPPLPPRRGGKGGGAPALRAVAVIVDARTMQSPPLPPRRGGRGGAARAGYDGRKRPPPHAGGKGGAARSTWLKRFITVMLEST